MARPNSASTSSVRRACDPEPVRDAISSNASWTSDTVSVLSAAGSGSDVRPRQPRPVRRWRSTPERYDVAVATSSGAASASAAASAAVLALRERVARTAAEAVTRS